MQITHEEFLKMQEERQNTNGEFTTKNTNFTEFLKLADGEKCLLRFSFKSPAELPIYTVHKVTVDGKFRNVNCIRNFRDPIDKCPLCAASKSYKQIIYLTALRYVTDEDGQLVKTQPVIWERPTGFLKDLNNYYEEYGDLSEMVFTLSKTVQMAKTRYSLMPKNAAIFNKQAYPADFSAFEKFSPMRGLIVDKSYDELVDMSTKILMVEGSYTQPITQPATQPNVTVPTYANDTSYRPAYSTAAAQPDYRQSETPVSNTVRRVTY